MGDLRFDAPYRRVKDSAERVATMNAMDDEDLIAALAGASRDRDPLIANVLGTAVLNRNAQLRSVFDHMSEGALLLGPDAKVRLMNPAFTQLLGWTLADLAERPVHDVLHPGCLLGTRCPIVEGFMGPGASIRQEDAAFARRDGARVPVGYSFSPLVDEGRVLGAVLIVRDMTSHKLHTEALERLAAIAANASDAIYTKTVGDIITSWNVGAEKLYGYNAREAVGQHIYLIVPDDRRGEVHVLNEIVHRQGQAMTMETQRRAKGGRTIDVSVSLTPIRDEHGRILGSTVITRDITPRKREQDIVRAALEAAPAAMIAADESGHILLANTQAETLFGYEKGALSSRLVEELLPEALRAAHSVHRSSFANSPHKRPMGAGLELYAQRKDGTQFRVEVGLTPILPSGNEGLVVIASIRALAEDGTLH